jgi:hypothetical protein
MALMPRIGRSRALRAWSDSARLFGMLLRDQVTGRATKHSGHAGAVHARAGRSARGRVAQVRARATAGTPTSLVVLRLALNLAGRRQLVRRRSGQREAALFSAANGEPAEPAEPKGKAKKAAPAVVASVDPKVVRAWAVERGLRVSTRGRLAPEDPQGLHG